VLELRKIAVTGGLACGKSSVCRILEKHGAYVVSADAIVHRLLSPDTAIGQKVIELLGSTIIVRNHTLDRKEIARIVFSDPLKLRALEKIIHPAVLNEIQKRFQAVRKQGKFKLFVAEIPLLYESEGELFFDLVIAVTAEEEIARRRFQEASGRSEQDYERRMARQMPTQEKAARADYPLTNNGSLQDLENQMMPLLQELNLT